MCYIYNKIFTAKNEDPVNTRNSTSTSINRWLKKFLQYIYSSQQILNRQYNLLVLKPDHILPIILKYYILNIKCFTTQQNKHNPNGHEMCSGSSYAQLSYLYLILSVYLASLQLYTIWFGMLLINSPAGNIVLTTQTCINICVCVCVLSVTMVIITCKLHLVIVQCKFVQKNQNTESVSVIGMFQKMYKCHSSN